MPEFNLLSQTIYEFMFNWREIPREIKNNLNFQIYFCHPFYNKLTTVTLYAICFK